MTRTRRPIVLTRRGQNVLAVAYTVLVLLGVAVALIAMLALVGAIEGGFSQ